MRSICMSWTGLKQLSGRVLRRSLGSRMSVSARNHSTDTLTRSRVAHILAVCIDILFMEKYKLIKKLGDGSFGVVYKALNTETGETVAIKRFKQKYTSWDECIELREVKSLRKLNHRNIIKLKEALQVADEFNMVFEYLEYNLLELYAKSKENNKRLTENEIRSIIYQVAAGLAYMHKNGFFHRDMKPENLLIYNNVVKICDFGLAREVRSRPPYTEYVSTRWYRAPQLLLHASNYNSPVDIFALGCIMAELYMQIPLFPGNNELDQINKIVKILGTPDPQGWPEGYKLAQSRKYYFPQEKGQSLVDLIPAASLEAIDLIESMLQYQPRKRPTALDILKHPYFNNFTPPSQDNPIHNKVPAVEPVIRVAVESKPLDTRKQDQIFRNTKERFRSTKDRFHNEPKAEEDLDSILNYLEQKTKKDKDKGKLPFINTKEGFNKREPRYESEKQSDRHLERLLEKPPERQPEKQTSIHRDGPRNFVKYQKEKKEEEVVIKLPGVRKEREQSREQSKDLPVGLNKLLSYGFQPQLNNAALQPAALQPIPPSKYGRPLGLGSNSNAPGLNPLIRPNIFKDKDILGHGLRARSQLPADLKY